MSASVPYMVKPGTTVLPLALPQSFDGPPTRGEAPIGLSGGGTTTPRRSDAKRSYTLGWDSLDEATADTLLGLYGGLFDDPAGTRWVFIDPTVRNVMGQNASATGQRSTVPIDWTQSAGSLVVSTSLVSPPNGAGVLSWSSLGASGTVAPGLTTSTSVDPTKGHPYVAAEPVTGSLYLYASASTSMTVRLQGYTSTGAVISGAVASTTATVTTAWQRVTVSIAAGASAFSTAAFVRMVLAGPSTAPSSTVSFSAAQLELATSVSTWQPGQGTPRVTITSGPGRTISTLHYSDHTLALAEC